MSKKFSNEEDADVPKGHTHVPHNGVDDEDDDDKDDTAFVDEDGRFDLCKALPNSYDNPFEYVYTREHTGRVVSVVCSLKKVPKEQVQSTGGRNKNVREVVVHGENKIKKKAGKPTKLLVLADLHATDNSDNEKKKATQ
ncbi:hypothetical protein MHU86_20335 [Fragilaria crotonensis]|nr:hypothetical protein MHU86_20335 [Fragilaria crotonensis]